MAVFHKAGCVYAARPSLRLKTHNRRTLTTSISPDSLSPNSLSTKTQVNYWPIYNAQVFEMEATAYYTSIFSTYNILFSKDIRHK